MPGPSSSQISLNADFRTGRGIRSHTFWVDLEDPWRYPEQMSAVSEIFAALAAHGVNPSEPANVRQQGSVGSVDGYGKPIRIYAWEVSDNGSATGVVRPADERRIQASRTQPIETDQQADTVILGWCDHEEFTDTPLLVAFNPGAVAARVNAKLERSGHTGRVSDSQQFRQALLERARTDGIAIGENQHGEFVVAMKPEMFQEYLSVHRPKYHQHADAASVPASMSMQDLVAEAEVEVAEPVDEVTQSPDFDPSAIEGGRERVAREIAIRRGQAAFRQRLIDAYGCCAISGSKVGLALEAAHIVPYQGPGTNHLSNGLLLRSDLHTLFDFGLLSVDAASLTILVSSKLVDSEYAAFKGQPLNLGHGKASPSPEALAHHRSFASL